MELESVFCDLQIPLDLKTAQIEASRCYYCYDAPCIQACPTEIDIPSFIRKISNQNVKGAAVDILSANIMGATCARVCPVEILCQRACVREKSEAKPVQIGQLQRFATDEYFRKDVLKSSQEPAFVRAKSTGKQVAVVGAGPAGLSCAHRLALFGHEVMVYEAREKSGGLNEYGLAPYKMTHGIAQKEIDFILSVGGIKIENNRKLGKDILLSDLQKQFSAVFLGLGLGGTNELNIPGEELIGVLSAVDMIATIRQTKELSKMAISKMGIPSEVVVIGGGNTAIDISIQMKKLGAQIVNLVYRRGPGEMGATQHEIELAQKNGVRILNWLKPVKIEGNAGTVRSIQFEYTENREGKILGTGKFLNLKADAIYKAIGQRLALDFLKTEGLNLKLHRQKISVDKNFETSVPGVYAGGDAIEAGQDLTVTAVQQGKLAALAIHQRLEGKRNG
ncbi:MAG: NAD(P)-dependent oxidoreductase [Bdellovibrionaceae bacterium]|nr:NAD(P)-dependent oxidoreductase [Pseudobdellovibrionaceae bacterium]